MRCENKQPNIYINVEKRKIERRKFRAEKEKTE